MRFAVRHCWTLCALSILPALAAAESPRAASPPAAGGFAETTEVTAVPVPVQVVRDGEPVRGLTAADFEIYEGKKPQAITGFEVLDLAVPGKAAMAVAPALRRHFLFLFDLSNSEPKAFIKARQMVLDVLPELQPSDLVAVATYSYADGPRLALGFTSDRGQAAKAIETLGLSQLVDRNPDPLGLVVGDLLSGQQTQGAQLAASAAAAAAASVTRGPGHEGLKLSVELQQAMNAALTSYLRGSYTANTTANKEQQQAQLSAMTRSFSDLARLMANVHGRKEVVYLSEGIDASLLQGDQNNADQAQMADDSMRGQSLYIDSDVRYGGTRQANVMEKLLEDLRRADCVVQSVDIGGIRAGNDQAPARPSGTAALFAMAHDTGGELYRNFNDLSTAMQQLLRKTSLTYVLTFQPELKRDGAYHALRVTLRGGGAKLKGAQVFARAGYYAPKPFGQQTASERRLEVADYLMGGGDGGTVHTSVLAAAFKVAGSDKNLANVPVLIEVDGEDLLANSPETALPLEIYAYAIDAQGSIQGFFSQSLHLDLGKVLGALEQKGLKFVGHLELPPGDYNVRVLVRNAATGAFGLRAQPVVVPEWSSADAVLLPPFFPELPGQWLMVRQTPKSQQPPPPYPFALRELEYVPAVRPVVAAGQDVTLVLVGYHLPAEGLKAEARVLAPDGRDFGMAALSIAGREGPDAGGEDRLTATFHTPRALQPGEYQLVVELTDTKGVAHHSGAPFVVAAAGQGSRG
jgi:VWFA-related protein